MELPQAEGFDLRGAIQRLRGKQSRVIDLLKRFADSSAQAHEHIAAHIKNNDIESARRLAHQLKGSGANLGANALSQKAAIIEQALMPDSDMQRDNTLSHDLASDLNDLAYELKRLHTYAANVKETETVYIKKDTPL